MTEQQTHFRMIDVSAKNPTYRRAIACGEIYVGEYAFQHLKNRTLPKGDALLLAEIAGINGAKKAYEIIPLCHPLALEQVSITIELDENNHSAIVYCTATATAKTGVEMEALAGVNAALLAIYDIVKNIEPALTLSQIRLLTKEGGKQGLWLHPDGIPQKIQQMLLKNSTYYFKDITAAIITISDRATAGEYQDQSGKILKKLLEDLGATVQHTALVADEEAQIIHSIKTITNNYAPQLIFTTGGTGLAPRDVTPEALQKVCDRLIPGLSELLRHDGANQYTKFAWLSRCVVGTLNKTLIIALPGNPKAVNEGIEILKEILPHAIHTISGKNHDSIS